VRSSLRTLIPAVLTAVGLLATLSPAPAMAADELSVTVLSPAPGSSHELGEVAVKVAVDLGGQPSGMVMASIGGSAAAVDVPAGSCDNGCEVTVNVLVGDWHHPGPANGHHPLSVHLSTPAGPSAQSSGGNLFFPGTPGPITDLQYVVHDEVFTEAVADDFGIFRVTSDRPDDSVAEVHLLDQDYKVLAAYGGPFDTIRDGHHDATVGLNLTKVPNGRYLVQARSRTKDGYYGVGKDTYLRVNHDAPAVFDGDSETTVVQGHAGFTGNVTVTGALLSGLTPSTVELIIGGAGTGTGRPTQLSAPWKSANWQYPQTTQTVQFTMTGPELPLGTHRLSLGVRATNGELIGTYTERTVTVIPNFQYGVSSPLLVVGRRSQVSIGVDAPADRLLTHCAVSFGDSARPVIPVGSWCTKPVPSLEVSPTVTPQYAGPNAFLFSLRDNTGNSGDFSFETDVYAARRAAVSAPAVPFGGRGTAKVVVQDSRQLNKWTAAPAGIVVYLQRQAVGTTRWVTLGSAKTVAGGIASIPFTSATNGAFRAVLASTVPLETLISPAIGAVSSATVAWRLAPRTATRGKAVTYQATATPYDVGSLAHLQVRRAGTSKWVTVKSISVPKTTIATFAYAFPGTGTWSVRVYRQATKQHTLGLSTAVSVKVK